MTPRLFICREGGRGSGHGKRKKKRKIESTETVKHVTLERVDLDPTRISSVLSLLSFRKFKVNQFWMSDRMGKKVEETSQVY